jgi:hypothetical protein
MADREMHTKDFVYFVKGEIKKLEMVDCRNLLDFAYGGTPIYLLGEK